MHAPIWTSRASLAHFIASGLLSTPPTLHRFWPVLEALAPLPRALLSPLLALAKDPSASRWARGAALGVLSKDPQLSTADFADLLLRAIETAESIGIEPELPILLEAPFGPERESVVERAIEGAPFSVMLSLLDRGFDPTSATQRALQRALDRHVTTLGSPPFDECALQTIRKYVTPIVAAPLLAAHWNATLAETTNSLCEDLARYPGLLATSMVHQPMAARELALPASAILTVLGHPAAVRAWKAAIHEQSFLLRCPVDRVHTVCDRISKRYARAVALSTTDKDFARMAAQSLLGATLAPSVRKDLLVALAMRDPDFVVRFVHERWSDEDSSSAEIFCDILSQLEAAPSMDFLRHSLNEAMRTSSRAEQLGALYAADRLASSDGTLFEPFCEPRWAPILRAKAFSALVRRGKTGPDRLEELLREREPAVRFEALCGLSDHPNPQRYIKVFLEAAQDVTGFCKSCSLNGQLKPAGCSWNWSMVEVAVQGLERIGGAVAMNVFLALLGTQRLGVSTAESVAAATRRLVLTLEDVSGFE
jgi:hypothetical protein